MASARRGWRPWGHGGSPPWLGSELLGVPPAAEEIGARDADDADAVVVVRLDPPPRVKYATAKLPPAVPAEEEEGAAP